MRNQPIPHHPSAATKPPHSWRLAWLASAPIGIACALSACGGGDTRKQSDAPEAIPNAVSDPVPHPETKDGYLVFRDQQHFDATVKGLRAMGREERTRWHQQQEGFTSSLEAFKAASAEAIADGENENPDQSPLLKDQIDFENRFLSQYRNIGHFEGENENRRLSPNINDKGLSSIVNHNGVIAIGSKLLRYTSDTNQSEISAINYAKLLAQKICPIDNQQLQLKSKIKNRCNPNDDTDNTDDPVDSPLKSAEENDGYTLYDVTPIHLHYPEGTWMKFSAHRRLVDPWVAKKSPSYYTFKIGASGDTANSADYGDIRVEGAEIIKEIGTKKIKVEPETQSFEFHIFIKADSEIEPKESLSVSIGKVTSFPQYIDADKLHCAQCQNWTKYFQNVIKKDMLEVRDIISQDLSLDGIITTNHQTIANSYKKSWGKWIPEDADIVIRGTVTGNKYSSSQEYVSVKDGSTVSQIWFYEHKTQPLDNPPHVDSMNLYVTRSGGAAGVSINTSY